MVPKTYQVILVRRTPVPLLKTRHGLRVPPHLGFFWSIVGHPLYRRERVVHDVTRCNWTGVSVALCLSPYNSMIGQTVVEGYALFMYEESFGVLVDPDCR